MNRNKTELVCQIICIVLILCLIVIVISAAVSNKKEEPINTTEIDLSSPLEIMKTRQTSSPKPTVTIESTPTPISTPTPSTTEQVAKEIIPEPTKSVEPTPKPTPITTESKVEVQETDIELLALTAITEAEGESEEGKRLVIDTVLNRVDDKHFPNTIRDVIFQKYQFSGMSGTRLEKCKRMFANDKELKEYYCNLAREEMKSRINSEVVFFHADHYGKYGTPMFRVGNHYFSKY